MTSRLPHILLTLPPLAALLAGCARTEHIPVYPPMPAPDVVSRIQDRSAHLTSATGKGQLTLEGRDGRSITIDVVYIWQSPDLARIRGWVFGQAVVDLTVRPDGVYLFAPRLENNSAIKNLTADQATAALHRVMRFLGSDLNSSVTISRESDDKIELTQPQPDGAQIISTIDPRTLTIRSCKVLDGEGIERFNLKLSEYALFNTTLWPQKIEGTRDGQKITLETSEFQPNVAAPNAFLPPARAKQIP